MTIYNATPAITSDNHSPLQSNFNIVTKSINHSIVITRPTPATGGTLFGFGTCHSSRKNIFLCRLWSLNKNISVSLLMPHTVIIKSSKWSKSAEFLQSFIISTCHPPHKSITIHFGDGIVIFFQIWDILEIPYSLLEPVEPLWRHVQNRAVLRLNLILFLPNWMENNLGNIS